MLPDPEERGYFPFAKGFQLVDIASKMKTTHALLIFNVSVFTEKVSSVVKVRLLKWTVI